MTYLSPCAIERGNNSAFSVPATPSPGSRSRLTETLAAKRFAIAQLEAAWVGTAEAAIAHRLPRSIQIADRATWDRTTWQCYLDAATTCEPEFKPQIMRLLKEIDAFEKLLAMPPMSRAA